MAIDIALTKHALGLLDSLGDHALPLDTFASELEIKACKPLTIQQVESLLAFAKAEGWTGTRRDRFQRDLHFITENGRTALRSM
jgi:hypothetical protein